MEISKVKISALKSNIGQIEGLPKNPRLVKDDKFEKLKKSLTDDPEMLELREVIAYDNNGELVVICGNMRLKALKELGVKEVATKILPVNTDVAKLKAYTIKDNVGFGEHDWDMLANEWDAEKLNDWGLELPVYLDESIEDIENAECFNESVNFTIKCDSLEQLEKLQTKLSCDTVKLSYADFLIKVGL